MSFYASVECIFVMHCIDLSLNIPYMINMVSKVEGKTETGYMFYPILYYNQVSSSCIN